LRKKKEETTETKEKARKRLPPSFCETHHSKVRGRSQGKGIIADGEKKTRRTGNKTVGA